MARTQELVPPPDPHPAMVRHGKKDLILLPKFKYNTVETIQLLLMYDFGSVQGPLGTVQGPHDFGSVQGPLGTVQGPHGWVCPGTPRFGLSRRSAARSSTLPRAVMVLQGVLRRHGDLRQICFRCFLSWFAVATPDARTCALCSRRSSARYSSLPRAVLLRQGTLRRHGDLRQFRLRCFMWWFAIISLVAMSCALCSRRSSASSSSLPRVVLLLQGASLRHGGCHE
jgi:hypothetical protein